MIKLSENRPLTKVSDRHKVSLVPKEARPNFDKTHNPSASKMDDGESSFKGGGKKHLASAGLAAAAMAVAAYAAATV